MFRIVARRSLYFHKRIAELGPTYAGCPTNCTRREQDRFAGCPRCEYQIQRKGFERECKAELEKVAMRLDDTERWPLEHLLDALSLVASAASTKGIGRKWTVPFAKLVAIYRDEKAKMKAVEDWRLKLKLDGEGNQSRRKGRKHDEDEYDEE